MKLMRIIIYECEDIERMKRQQEASISDGIFKPGGDMIIISYFIAENTPEAQKVLDIKEEIEEQIERNT